MCLDLKKTSIKVKARIDKVCYKHLIVINDELFTPYRRSMIRIGNTYKSKLIKYGENYYYVDLGLHSFKNLDACIKDAKSEFNLNRFCFTLQHRYIIVKCIIPKGSYYYTGSFDGSASYASDTIKYLEII